MRAVAAVQITTANLLTSRHTAWFSVASMLIHE